MAVNKPISFRRIRDSIPCLQPKQIVDLENFFVYQLMRILASTTEASSVGRQPDEPEVCEQKVNKSPGFSCDVLQQ